MNFDDGADWWIPMLMKLIALPWWSSEKFLALTVCHDDGSVWEPAGDKYYDRSGDLNVLGRCEQAKSRVVGSKRATDPFHQIKIL